MQMGEMVLVLVIAFIIGIAALTFFVRRSGEESARSNSEQLNRALVITAKEVAALPGIRYSLDSREDLTAIDLARARAFADFVQEPIFRDVYRERFSGYRATITATYPPAADYTSAGIDYPFQDVILFDYTDSTTAVRNSVPFVIPVLIYEPISDSSGFGLLTITQVNE